jgi:hypothetical protein
LEKLCIPTSLSLFFFFLFQSILIKNEINKKMGRNGTYAARNTPPAIRARKKIPPTSPPTMAPVLPFFFFSELEEISIVPQLFTSKGQSAVDPVQNSSGSQTPVPNLHG